MIDNAYLTNPEDGYETPWYLLKGGIFESFRYDTFESFNEKLWQLLVAITSKYKKDDHEKQRMSDTLTNIVLMVKGCHYFCTTKSGWDIRKIGLTLNGCLIRIVVWKNTGQGRIKS